MRNYKALKIDAARRAEEARQKALYIVMSPYRLFKAVCFAIGFAVLVGMFIFSIALYGFLRSMPPVKSMDFTQLKALAQKRVAKRFEVPHKHRAWVELKAVNRDLLYAIVMSEDATFFEHDGVDIEAMMNSAAINILKKKYEYGASTISQQVTKMLFLTTEKSILRKVKELLVTKDLESRFTKNQILEIYLNMAELGPDLYGVQEGAMHYFHKTPAKINAAEGAFLALMLPSPRKYHYAVFENRNLSPHRKRKIRRILGDMLANDLISHEQYRHYLKYDYFRAVRSRGIAHSRGD